MHVLKQLLSTKAMKSNLSAHTLASDNFSVSVIAIIREQCIFQVLFVTDCVLIYSFLS